MDNPDEVLSVMHEIAPLIGVIKVTPCIIMYDGLGNIIEEAHSLGLKVFLDIKLHDIPNTVHAAVKTAISRKVDMITLHVGAGAPSLEAAAQARREMNSEIMLLGVVRLTSEEKRCDQEIYDGAVKARECGLRGLICAGNDIADIKRAFPDSITMVPGIRLNSDAADDQKRVTTPQDAINAGADYIIIGRLITRAKDRLALLRTIVDGEIATTFQGASVSSSCEVRM